MKEHAYMKVETLANNATFQAREAVRYLKDGKEVAALSCAETLRQTLREIVQRVAPQSVTNVREPLPSYTEPLPAQSGRVLLAQEARKYFVRGFAAGAATAAVLAAVIVHFTLK